MKITPSQIRSFLESKDFEDWCRSRDAEHKTEVTQIACLNEVIKGTSQVARMIGRRGF